MKKVSLANYKDDKYYPKVVQSVCSILDGQRFVAPVDVFRVLELLTDQDISRWKKGGIPYLEKVIKCNLGKACRILRILRFHAHDLNLRPSMTVYKGRKGRLRFTKTGDKTLEDAYSRHFVVIGNSKPGKAP